MSLGKTPWVDRNLKAAWPRLIEHVPDIRWEELTEILCPEELVNKTVKSLRRFLAL